MLKTDETACSTQREGGHISLLSPVHISSVHTDNNDLLSVSTLSSHNAETANHRPFLPGPSCYYQTGVALNPLFRNDSRHVQHRTLHREMIITSHRYLSCLAAGENFKDESGFFSSSSTNAGQTRHGPGTEIVARFGWSPFPLLLFLSQSSVPPLFPQEVGPMFASAHLLATVDGQICSRCSCASSTGSQTQATMGRSVFCTMGGSKTC